MLKQLLKTSLVLSGVIVLSGCDVDQSFSTQAAPVYTTTGVTQATTVNRAPIVTTTNQMNGNRSMVPPFRGGSDDNASHMVTTTQQPTVVVTPGRASGPEGFRPVPVTIVTPTSRSEPSVNNAPSDVINTYHGAITTTASDGSNLIGT